jgi:hypothetical protein
MTLFPMPRVVDPAGGRMIVEVGGKRHIIAVRADPISQRAVVNDDVSEIPKSKKTHLDSNEIKQALSSGTSVRIEWKQIPSVDGITKWPFDEIVVGGANSDAERFTRRFRDLCIGFAMFNPHLTLHVDWFGERLGRGPAAIGQGQWFSAQTRNNTFLEYQKGLTKCLEKIRDATSSQEKSYPAYPLRGLMRECESYLDSMEFILNEA